MPDAAQGTAVITAGGTLAAAVLTGFGAAGLKHRWDRNSEDVRWQRERSERRRDELRAAFVSYFGALRTLEERHVAAWRESRDRTANSLVQRHGQSAQRLLSGEPEPDQRELLADEITDMMKAVRAPTPIEEALHPALKDARSLADQLSLLLGSQPAKPFHEHLDRVNSYWVSRLESDDRSPAPDGDHLRQIAHEALRR